MLKNDHNRNVFLIVIPTAKNNAIDINKKTKLDNRQSSVPEHVCTFNASTTTNPPIIEPKKVFVHSPQKSLFFVIIMKCSMRDFLKEV